MNNINKRMLPCLIIVLCILLSSCSKIDDNKKTDLKQEKGECWNEYSLSNVRMTGRGDNSNDYKISFRPSKNKEGISAYLVGYSSKSIKEVRDYLGKMSKGDICALDKPTNRAYIINDLSYADGVGNTLNTDQRDMVTGGDISEPGTYYFYACTIGEKGLLGIEQAKETAVQDPYAGKLAITVNQNTVEGTFESYQSKAIIKNLIFYSTDGYVLMKQALEKYSKDQLMKLIKDGCALGFDNNTKNTFQFSTDQQKDVDRNIYNKESCYYVYVASVGENGLIGLSYCDNTFLTPKTLPIPLKSIGRGMGHGYVFPNGGAASIGSSRDSIISKAQSMFGTIQGTPRIAVIGASSGKESEIYSYFYVDDSSADSYMKRFKEAGFEAVYIPLTDANYQKIGENNYYADLIESCHGVYFTGGDQSKAARAIYRNDGSLNLIGEAITHVFERGGIIMGTSAGAHVVSSPCFQDGSSYSVLHNNKAEAFDICKLDSKSQASSQKTGNSIYYNALDLARNAAGEGLIFDSHFNARGRFGRLTLICRDTKNRFGAGLDEATGLSVSDGIGTVYGAGGVTIIDTKNAKYGTGDSFEVKDLEVYYLSAGDRFDFKNSTVMPFSDKKELKGSGKPEEIKDIFAQNYATTRAFISFMQSNKDSISYQALSDMEDSTLKPFKVTLHRTKKTSIYQSENTKYNSINALVNYKKTAYSNMIVDITN